MMSPREFKRQYVDENVAEFLAEPNDVRRAVNAMWAVDALVAHIWRWAHERKLMSHDSDDRYRDELAKDDSAYAVVRDAANAVKHAKLTRTKNPIVTVSESFASVGPFQADMVQENVFQRRQAVVETTSPRRVLPVAQIITAVLTKLESEMERLGAP